MATIGIDCRFAGTHSGLGRYTRELVTSLLRRSDDVRYVLFAGRDTSWIPTESSGPHRIITVRSRHYSLGEQLILPAQILRARLDLFFAPHFNVPLVCPVPFVATIHDLILHRYPNQASATKRRAYNAVMKHTVKRARSLIAVSTFTAGEITKTYGKDLKKKISVIHEAASPVFGNRSGVSCGPVLKKYGLQKPFFLYVGNCKEHKNVQMLIDAYAQLGSTENELVLVTGGKEAESLRLCDGVRVLTNIADADLPCLYFFALCFVTASLYEGFGLPVIEAAAAGCPVIATDCGALPEIAPPGSRIVAPTIDELAEALREPPEPSDPGHIRTWDEVAEQTFIVLSSALRA